MSIRRANAVSIMGGLLPVAVELDGILLAQPSKLRMKLLNQCKASVKFGLFFTFFKLIWDVVGNIVSWIDPFELELTVNQT